MESISKILECPICFRRMSAPKMLPCQHTFCLECTKKVATKKQVQCALFQRKHKLPVNGVIGLPNNSILEDLFQLTYSNHFNQSSGSSIRIIPMEGTNAKDCNSSKVRNKMNTNMKKSKKVCFEMNFRFHMVQIEEMVNGNH